ncbi:NAD(P)H-binding protein [Francisella philomiragia]|uniref:RmlD substrate binding domain protein n=1 Tax=Francisella philomiragia TaxID=28110 RepID=A0A0B6D1C9_9GAMM|nr:NAD(P)H-binding protein [Francisella philomiragia]AJI52691.1 rmlD substrate binding domain protein [Francisella philomiragia]
MRVLVLGGTKFVGLEFLKNIDKSINEVYVISRRAVDVEGVKSIALERDDSKELENAIISVDPDVILDMICYNQRQANDIINISSKLRNLNHYIMISTFFIYNYSDVYEGFEIVNEELIRDNYTKNKYLAEKTIYNSSLFEKATIIRPPFIIAYDDYSQRFQFLIESIRSNTIVIDEFRNSFISKNEMAKALLKLICEPPLGFLDLANKGCVSLKDIVDIVSHVLNQEFDKLTYGKREVYQLDRSICLDSKHLDLFDLKDVRDVLVEEIGSLK